MNGGGGGGQHGGETHACMLACMHMGETPASCMQEGETPACMPAWCGCLSAHCTCREEGLAGLWKGLGPNVARNAIINAAELASYDQVGGAGGPLMIGEGGEEGYGGVMYYTMLLLLLLP